MTRIAITFLVLIVLSSSACRVDDLSKENNLINVEDEYVLEMWEELNGASRNFQFIVKTISQQDCTNATISFTKEQQEQILSFSLNNIQAPEVCHSGQAPATANILFSTLETGDYNISIYLKETIVNHGKLTVSSLGYTLQMESELGFRLLNDELLKIFDNTIWGYISYNNPDYAVFAEEALETISNLSEYKAYQMGNYGYFSVIDQENNLLPTIPINDLYKSFIYKYTGEVSSLKSTIEGLRAEYGDKLDFLVYTATGENL